MKIHYLLTQIAHIVRQLLEYGITVHQFTKKALIRLRKDVQNIKVV
jgi:hypothetical protein